MSVEIHPLVQPVLDEYLACIERDLPGYLIGFYLHGSLALGEYQPGFSDIDFISVISRRSTADDVAKLTSLHADLKQKYPKLLLSGSYLQLEDLGRLAKSVQAAPYFQDGVLQQGHFDINHVTWWMLKNRGLTLLGTPAEQLDISVDMDAMIADMRQNINTYWAGFTRKPARMAWLLSDYGIQWAIPGVLRQFYTFRERSIVSKTAACEYALTVVPDRWHRIIQEAIHVRHGDETRLYKLRVLRALDAILFLSYIIRESNKTS